MKLHRTTLSYNHNDQHSPKIDSAFAKQLSGKERSRTKADELTSNRDTNIIIRIKLEGNLIS